MSNTGIAYYYSRTKAGTFDWPYEHSMPREVLAPHCRRYRVARLGRLYHDILNGTMRTVGRLWLEVTESGYYD